MRPAPSCAAAANPARHQRHRPEETTLYRVVQAHCDTFLACVDINNGGAGVPKFVTDEFDAFLQCGILAMASCGYAATLQGGETGGLFLSPKGTSFGA